MPIYNFMKYVIFGFGDAAPHQTTEFFSLVILLLMTYFIMVITSFTEMFMSMATLCELPI